jgi:hypothetical protein
MGPPVEVKCAGFTVTYTESALFELGDTLVLV